MTNVLPSIASCCPKWRFEVLLGAALLLRLNFFPREGSHIAVAHSEITHIGCFNLKRESKCCAFL